MSIHADHSGIARGKFTIPANIPAGVKSVEIIGERGSRGLARWRRPSPYSPRGGTSPPSVCGTLHASHKNRVKSSQLQSKSINGVSK